MCLPCPVKKMPETPTSRAHERERTKREAAPAPTLVLIVLPILSGGSGRMTIDLCKALEKERIETSVFLSLGAGELVSEAENSGIKLYSYHRGDGTGAVRALLLVPVLLLRLLRRARAYDVLVGGGDASDHLPTLVVGRLTGKPAVGISQVAQSANLGSHQGLGHRLMSLATRIALPRLDATISVAEAVREDVIGLGARRERAYAIPNGIPVARVQELGRVEKIEYERPTIVTVGRLSPEKGLDDLLRAHALAREEIAHDLLIIGDGIDRPRLEELTTELGLRDSVTFSGYHTNPYPTIAAADLVCLPSHHEASPLIILEALALDRPVLATDCPGGTRESLGDGRFGQLVPVGDPKAFAGAVVEHLKAPEKLRTLAAAGRAEVTKNRDVAAVAARYAEVIREIVEVHDRARNDPARRPRR